MLCSQRNPHEQGTWGGQEETKQRHLSVPSAPQTQPTSPQVFFIILLPAWARVRGVVLFQPSYAELGTLGPKLLDTQ